MVAKAAEGKGKVALVTGAGSGIGKSAAHRFARDGFSVACADIDLPAARGVADEIAQTGAEAVAMEVDISSEPSVAALAGNVIDWAGRLDAVAANAGIMVEGGILSLSLEDWNRALGVNATGAFLTARAVLPHLVQSRGTLVFTCSTVALAGMRGVAAYSASKGAVAALTRQLAADFAPDGVRVNAVAPGAVRTPLSESQFQARAESEKHYRELLDKVIARYPLARWGQPEEIAEAILFLATDRAAWITGQIMEIEGGLLSLR